MENLKRTGFPDPIFSIRQRGMQWINWTFSIKTLIDGWC